MNIKFWFALLTILPRSSFSLPDDFVYLKDIAPDIIQDIRYATPNNFIGTPIPGYIDNTCITTRKAAQQLQRVQQEVKKRGYRLKVYDCYRPQKAVNYFYLWSKDPQSIQNKSRYYPREDKETLFDKGYIAKTSGHTRGSTFDLTLVKLEHSSISKSHSTFMQCYDKTPNYLDDDSIDMGTRFDCLDPSANIQYSKLSSQQQKNRRLLRHLMVRYGFTPYVHEWWHFTLANEPHPNSYFNFSVKK